MGIGNFFRKLFSRAKPGEAPKPEPKAPQPLREFVYLDEVSLLSLLASQKGAITDQISSEELESREAELTTTAKTGLPGVLETDLEARLQEQKQLSTQISRKAIVQSWFGEFHALPDLRLISNLGSETPIESVKSLEDLEDVESPSTVLREDNLTRGSLIEMRVELTADPIFTMKTLITEFAGMIGEAPDIFSETEGLEPFEKAGSINIILKKLLAGLIPIRCRALDHVIAVVADKEYIVHIKAISGLDIATRPLDVVGVTEAPLYWRDIRRVLFSDAAFTVLARVSRNGIHQKWNPVKLAQIFKDIIPDVAETMSDASLSALGGSNTPKIKGEFQEAVKLESALSTFGNHLLEQTGLADAVDAERVQLVSQSLKSRWKTVSDQNMAFDEMKRQLLADNPDVKVDPEKDLALRQSARASSGLSLFPDDEKVPLIDATGNDSAIDSEIGVDELFQPAYLIDVEFIAIYW